MEENFDADLLLEHLESRFIGRVHTTGNGREFLFDCPFCGGDRRGPCFHFNVDKGQGHCWRASCGWKGGFRKFLNESDGLENDEVDALLAIRHLTAFEIIQKELSSIKIEPKSPSSLFDIKSEDYYNVIGSINLNSSNINDYEQVSRWIKYRGYDPIEFVTHHDISYPMQFGRYKDRVIFNIDNDGAKVFLAYSMDTDEKIKTINADGADMSRYLYNYNHAKAADTIFVVEGIFDCARTLTYQAHIPNSSAVAVFGTSLNVDKGDFKTRLLQKTKAKEVVICLDHGAEDKAWSMFLHLGKWLGKQVSLMRIFDEGKDPDNLPLNRFLHFYERRRFYQSKKVHSNRWSL